MHPRLGALGAWTRRIRRGQLYISSLSEPPVAERVHREFTPILESPSGHFSELVVASEYLQGIGRGNNLELEAPLRELVARLLG